VQVIVHLPESALEEADVLLEIAADRSAGQGQAVLLSGEHLDELPASGEERLEGGERVVGQRAGLWPHALGEEGEHLGIEGIGLGELAGGLAKSRTWRGLATTTGSCAVTSAATSAAS
jgi:hypothetical protein